MIRRAIILCWIFFGSLSWAGAAEKPKAMFALVIGSNQSVDAELVPLHYADDDAARYFDLFRSLGARTYLLSRLDDNTLRLHPQAAAEAQHPMDASLQKTVQLLAYDILQAQQRGVETVLYFVFAGHGNIKNGQGYITLEDVRLTGTQIAEQIITPVKADQVHLIVDACYSYYLAYARGPGGSRRAIRGFSQVETLAQYDQVGLLLSTSSARESHEWEAFQAGIFSHEVRSGLYGAADADGDGQVSYRELAAFIERANAAIPNDRFRPRFFARAPRNSEQLLDLRSALPHRLQVEGEQSGHYYLEDNRGIRLADFHNGPGRPLQVLLPTGSQQLFLHRVGDDQEFAIPSFPQLIRLAGLKSQAARTQVRGAAHESFALIFSLPFDNQAVERYVFPPAQAPLEAFAQLEAQPPWRRVAKWSALGIGAASLVTGVALTLSARDLRDSSPQGETQVDVAARNHLIETRNQAAAALYAVAGGATLAGFLLLLWPDHSAEASGSFGAEGAMLFFRQSF